MVHRFNGTLSATLQVSKLKHDLFIILIGWLFYMKIISMQEAFKSRFERQNCITDLEYHASGHCVHVGMLSPGCYHCFASDVFSRNFHPGSSCNCQCVYCYGVEGECGFPATPLDNLEKKARLMKHLLAPEGVYNKAIISFTGGGEPLMYLNLIEDYMNFFQDIEEHMKSRPWYYLYTNGTLANIETLLKMRDMGFDEIRFHLGASNFSKEVYKNVSKAVRLIDTVTVETPAWPPHRQKLFEMLPIIDDIGVKHLNIGQIEITESNREKIACLLPEAEVYQCYNIHLDDGGLVYDLIEEVIKNKYSFSVLDCSCLVKSIQRSPGKHLMCENIDGLCVQRDTSDPRKKRVVQSSVSIETTVGHD